MIKTVASVLLLGLILAPVSAQSKKHPGVPTLQPGSQDFSEWDEERDGPLPHWPIPPRAPRPGPRSVIPYSISAGAGRGPVGTASEIKPMHVPSGPIVSQREFGPTDGILFRFATGAWPQVVTDCVAGITGDPTRSDKAYVVVASSSVEAIATTFFTNAGADMSKVVFMHMPSDAIWLTDYGPNFILQDGAPALVDSNYYILSRTKDNFVPTQVGEDNLQIPVYAMGMGTSARGNLLVGSDGVAYASDVIEEYNPDFTVQYIADLYQEYLGIDTLHLFPALPTTVDLTGHIDMWMNLVDDQNVVISQFAPGSNATAIAITDNAAIYMANLGFNVFRVPDSVGPHPGWPGADIHFTYTNGFRINDRLFIIKYGDGDPARIADDQAALAVYQAAAPTCQIIQIDCYDIIWAAGAMHCITMNVPRRDESIPAVHLESPDGGELLVSGTTYEIEWSAIDDVAVTGIDLRYSTDGGASFPYLIASGLANDGREPWTVPTLPGVVDRVVLQVDAHDGTGNRGRDWSDSLLEIRVANQKVYDFSTGGGVDKWGWGVSTDSWSDLDGVRRPAAVNQTIDSVDPLAYSKISISDATGGDTDTNRYSSSLPPVGEESTHIFEFDITENPATILDIALHWEGYGDACGQTELYVWNAAGQNWSDGAGTLGENMYVENFAGNRDGVLEGNIRKDFADYIESNGRLTLLVYTEYVRKRAFHDYISVTVTRDGP